MEKDNKSESSEITKANSESSDNDPYAHINDEERLKKGEEIKNEGNSFFKQNKFEQAVEKYDEAVKMLPLNHARRSVFLCNKSMCSVKLETPGQALIDAEEAIKYDPKNIKAYYRKAIAFYALNKLKDALLALQYITNTLKIKTNKDVNEKIKILQKIKKERDFLKAIEYQDETDQLDPDSLSIPSDYKGLRLEEDKPIPRKWVLDLMEYFKDQKKLHKKYVWMMIKKMIEILDKEPNLNFLNVKDDLKVIDSEDGEKYNLEFNYQKYDSVRYTLPKITVCGDIHGEILYLYINLYFLIYL